MSVFSIAGTSAEGECLQLHYQGELNKTIRYLFKNLLSYFNLKVEEGE